MPSRLLSCLALLALTAFTARAQGATISGIVYDSLARAPLAGAVVQLAGDAGAARISRAAIADSVGRYSLADIPDGQYQIAFLHPMLDSLFLEPIVRQVTMSGGRALHVDLAIPSPQRLRAAICGARDSLAPPGFVVGVARSALDGTPISGAEVAGEWVEFGFTRTGIVRRNPRLVARTGDNGWFAICNVPGEGTIALLGSRGADSTDRLEVRMPESGFLRRELYLGSARSVARADTGLRRGPTPRFRVGDGRLSGTVSATSGGQPIVDAQVMIVDAPPARTNAKGEWALVDVPAGTRMLEVRAVGYYPDRRLVDVIPGAAPVRTLLSTFKAMLDTVKVTAERIRADENGFQERRRSGVGRFLTPDDVASRGGVTASDIFRAMPGLRLGPASDTMEMNLSRTDSLGRVDWRILARGPMGVCVPTIFIDGMPYRDLLIIDLDAWVVPQRITGIEVYTTSTPPPQYQDGMTACGSIVIWTKRA